MGIRKIPTDAGKHTGYPFESDFRIPGTYFHGTSKAHSKRIGTYRYPTFLKQAGYARQALQGRMDKAVAFAR